ncbi:unnamed protein product [Penicillium pancosmium]
MATGSLHNVVSLVPRDHNMEEVLRAFSDFAAYIKANEPGTLQYYAVNPEGIDELIIIEKFAFIPAFIALGTCFILMGERRYADRDSLKLHAESEAFRKFQQEVVPLLQSPPVIRRAVNSWGFEDRNSAYT